MASAEIKTRDPDQLLVIIDEQDQEIELLRAEIRLLKQKRFSASNEAFNSLQVPLFPVDERDLKDYLDKAESDQTNEPAHLRRKQKNTWLLPTIFPVCGKRLIYRRKKRSAHVASPR